MTSNRNPARRERREFSEEFKAEAVRMAAERRSAGAALTQIGHAVPGAGLRKKRGGVLRERVALRCAVRLMCRVLEVSVAGFSAYLNRPERWPVMPVAWHSFAIKPVGFFGRSPAMDIPRQR